MILLGLFWLVLLLGPIPVGAHDFSAADQYFANRENNLSNLKRAEDLYQDALNQVAGQDLLYAVQQLGKIYYYWGELLTPEDKKDVRKSIFGRCRAMVERIHPNIVGDNAAYSYWKSTCFAFWVKSATTPEVMGVRDELLAALREGLSRWDNYEEGGIHRTAATVYMCRNSERDEHFVGLYDENKASYHIHQALEKDQNKKHYCAHLLKAEVLLARGKREDAQEWLEESKMELDQRIASNQLPCDALAESKAVSILMAAFLSTL